MAPKTEYNEKGMPISVRLSREALRALDKMRNNAGLSQGDFVEWLMRETDPLKVVQRGRAGDLTERISFRISARGEAIMKGIMDGNEASGGDVVEAYVRRAAKI
jgi:hypothetical protein